jgi:tetratricopeptide (TPR) repeat protein
MVALRVYLSACALLLVTSTMASGAGHDPWMNSKILPKSADVRLMVGASVVGGVHDIAWPATVERREGQWLWISDKSGLSNPAAEGWLSTDDVIKLEQAPSYYGSLLQKGEAAWIYWLRGIYWEEKSELPMAIGDYQQASSRDPSLADVHLRLGRSNSKIKEVVAGRPWEEHFKRASALRSNSAQIYYEWGDALRAAYEPVEKPEEKEDCFSDAEKHFATARQANPSCHRSHLGWAELLLSRAKKQQDNGIDCSQTLDKAIRRFDEAIQWNPDAIDAYRDRGEAYRMLAGLSPDDTPERASALDQAKRSAQRACEMADFRAPLSLKVLATIYHDLDQNERAIHYLSKAAEYAPEGTRAEITQLVKDYATDLATTLAVNDAASAKETARGIRDLPAGVKPPDPKQIEALIPEIIPRSLSAAPE